MKKYLIVALVALSVITAFGFLIHQNKNCGGSGTHTTTTPRYC